MLPRSATFALLALLAACSAQPTGAPAPPLSDLHGSLDPLRAWFEAHAGAPRVIMLLSPV